ncbi:MAG TPA: hypothetical protein VHO06_00145 [Polyangia bacterium]|nr:hypothetical protein [Polyangia bacterium]
MRHFLRWESEKPEAFREFVLWAVRNPTQGFEVYARLHPDNPIVQEVAIEHVLSAQAFINWCRSYPGPAEALVDFPRPLDWIGDNLYRL